MSKIVLIVKGSDKEGYNELSMKEDLTKIIEDTIDKKTLVDLKTIV